MSEFGGEGSFESRFEETEEKRALKILELDVSEGDFESDELEWKFVEKPDPVETHLNWEFREEGGEGFELRRLKEEVEYPYEYNDYEEVEGVYDAQGYYEKENEDGEGLEDRQILFGLNGKLEYPHYLREADDRARETRERNRRIRDAAELARQKELSELYRNVYNVPDVPYRQTTLERFMEGDDSAGEAGEFSLGGETGIDPDPNNSYPFNSVVKREDGIDYSKKLLEIGKRPDSFGYTQVKVNTNDLVSSPMMIYFGDDLEGPIRIGRGKDTDLRLLQDNGIDNTHPQVSIRRSDSGEILIIDGGSDDSGKWKLSTNGLWILKESNGLPVYSKVDKQHTLKEGDVFLIGGVQMAYRRDFLENTSVFDLSKLKGYDGKNPSYEGLVTRVL